MFFERRDMAVALESGKRLCAREKKEAASISKKDTEPSKLGTFFGVRDDLNLRLVLGDAVGECE